MDYCYENIMVRMFDLDILYDVYEWIKLKF